MVKESVLTEKVIEELSELGGEDFIGIANQVLGTEYTIDDIEWDLQEGTGSNPPPYPFARKSGVGGLYTGIRNFVGKR